MKFAKELEADLVPEWRVKYFDYKQGKKKIKVVVGAIKAAQRSIPSTPTWFHRTIPSATDTHQQSLRPGTLACHGSDTRFVQDDLIRKMSAASGQMIAQIPATSTSSAQTPAASSLQAGNGGPSSKQFPTRNHSCFSAEAEHRSDQDNRKPSMTRYDSDIRNSPSPLPRLLPPLTTLKLPAPAIDVHSSREGLSVGRSRMPPRSRSSMLTFEYARRPTYGRRLASAHDVGRAEWPAVGSLEIPIKGSKRPIKLGRSMSDGPIDAFHTVDKKNAEFEIFLEKQLHKVESFYKSKEKESTQRLQELREQLHIMRKKHYEELEAQKAASAAHKERAQPNKGNATAKGQHVQSDGDSSTNCLPLMPTGRAVIHQPMKAVKQVRLRKMREPYYLATPENPPRDVVGGDYERRKPTAEVPYSKARRKLKLALQELYRGLELLQGYALLNRTAFQKINKKYDKAVFARPPMKFMFERVNNAYFVTSNVLESQIRSVEDLYARYFKKGDRKDAANKLRQNIKSQQSFTGSAFRCGLLGGVGLVFGFQGLVAATEKLANPNPILSIHTSYLLQLYGGYFALLLLAFLFCLNCKIFKDSKINYVFVFDFNGRHNLDWWQLSELPCFCLFLLGFLMWMNFLQIGGPKFYIYYPVILIGVTLIILFLPLPILYHETRKWLSMAIWRLFWAGLYPVEFRDFFLGDMLCSQAFAMGNIELFFCLYAHRWNDPPQCNSSNSRLLGFFTCLPGIWRFLQCLRRYRDTGKTFPHIANAGKYSCMILYYMFLSIYRIHRNLPALALFIVFAAANAIYCSIWDIVMDWSLFTLHMSPPLLRQQRGFRNVWPYYLAMVLDPVLRCNWALYIAFPLQTQHSTLMSFMVAICEVCRRGMWTTFRVENGHCTNVSAFKANRDVPLPYKLEPVPSGDYQRKTGVSPKDVRGKDKSSSTSARPNRDSPTGRMARAARATLATPVAATVAGPHSMSTIMHLAHDQDFQRKRSLYDVDDVDEDDEDDDEYDEYDDYEDDDIIRSETYLTRGTRAAGDLV